MELLDRLIHRHEYCRDKKLIAYKDAQGPKDDCLLPSISLFFQNQNRNRPRRVATYFICGGGGWD